MIEGKAGRKGKGDFSALCYYLQRNSCPYQSWGVRELSEQRMLSIPSQGPPLFWISGTGHHHRGAQPPLVTTCEV